MTKNIFTVKDLLYCEDLCSVEAHKKILHRWSGDYIKKVEKSKQISVFGAEELNLINKLFGSDAHCYSIGDHDVQVAILRIIPYDIYKNFRRATFNKPMDILIEDWIWNKNDSEFVDDLDVELTCLSNIITSLLLYLLGGFVIPKDDLKSKMDKWLKVDVHSIFNRPRELFLLTSLSPAILARYCYWKCTAVLMGFMRLFSVDVDEERLTNLHQKLIQQGIIDGSETKNR